MNGCAPGLALIERLKATPKWAISQTELVSIFPKSCDFKIGDLALLLNLRTMPRPI